MLHTTFRMIQEAGGFLSSFKSYKKMAKALGGVQNYGEDTPIPLDKVLEVCGLNDALWVLQATIEPGAQIDCLLAYDYAKHVLPVYEKEVPNDKTLREGLEVARKVANGEATLEELDTAILSINMKRQIPLVAMNVRLAVIGAIDGTHRASLSAYFAREARRQEQYPCAVPTEQAWQKQHLLEKLRSCL